MQLVRGEVRQELAQVEQRAAEKRRRETAGTLRIGAHADSRMRKAAHPKEAAK